METATNGAEFIPIPQPSSLGHVDCVTDLRCHYNLLRPTLSRSSSQRFTRLLRAVYMSCPCMQPADSTGCQDATLSCYQDLLVCSTTSGIHWTIEELNFPRHTFTLSSWWFLRKGLLIDAAGRWEDPSHTRPDSNGPLTTQHKALSWLINPPVRGRCQNHMPVKPEESGGACLAPSIFHESKSSSSSAPRYI